MSTEVRSHFLPSLDNPSKKKVSELSKGLEVTESHFSQFQQAHSFASVVICIKLWIKGLLSTHKGCSWKVMVLGWGYLWDHQSAGIIAC